MMMWQFQIRVLPCRKRAMCWTLGLCDGDPAPVRKRHVPEPERLRQLAAKLKGQADKLSREADALLAEADALECPPAKEKPSKLRPHTLR